MFTPAPIGKSFVPYAKRPVLKHNAALFVDGAGGRGRASGRVVPQNAECAGQPNGKRCGSYPNMFCCDGECKFGSDC